MRTLGIDLASQAKNTASCAIEWLSELELPQTGRPESDVLDEMLRADSIGIDAPFGWPDAMVAAIADYAETGRWPQTATPERMRCFRFPDACESTGDDVAHYRNGRAAVVRREVLMPLAFLGRSRRLRAD